MYLLLTRAFSQTIAVYTSHRPRAGAGNNARRGLKRAARNTTPRVRVAPRSGATVPTSRAAAIAPADNLVPSRHANHPEAGRGHGCSTVGGSPQPSAGNGLSGPKTRASATLVPSTTSSRSRPITGTTSTKAFSCPRQLQLALEMQGTHSKPRAVRYGRGYRMVTPVAPGDARHAVNAQLSVAHG